MPTVYVIAPAGGQTGGVELLHQLVHALNSDGKRAAVIYYPFHNLSKSPAIYTKYECPIASIEEIHPSDIVVIGETYTYLLHHFRSFNVMIWWMSVDNYINSRSVLFALRNGFLPWRYLNLRDRRPLDRVHTHLVQSEYAKQFLYSRGITNVARLGDYINDDYLCAMSSGSHAEVAERENFVVYNPLKGIEQTRRIIRVLGESSAIPLQGLSRDQVKQLLQKAKVYIDFGNHPGKDRIPREAAAMGCCVITNRRGSAANSQDVPTPEQYRIDDTQALFENGAATLIEEIMNDFARHTKNFDGYRAEIKREKNQFLSDVRRIFFADEDICTNRRSDA